LNDETGYDFDLTEKDFVELFTGKYIKGLLFDSKSYEKKRHYIEEYSKVSYKNYYISNFFFSLLIIIFKFLIFNFLKIDIVNY